MEIKKTITINSKWYAYSILKRIFETTIENDSEKIIKISDTRVFDVFIWSMVSLNSKRILYSLNKIGVVSRRTASDCVLRLKGLEIIDFENTTRVEKIDGKKTKKQGYNRYWIHDRFLETEDTIYKIDWSKLK